MHNITKEKHMKKILALLAATLYLLAPQANAQNTITGAGATFPFPIYSKWAEIYSEKNDIRLNYQSIGSSGGLRQIKAKTVIFGASDAPMSGAELEKDGLVQFPAIIGGTVPIVNLQGFDQVNSESLVRCWQRFTWVILPIGMMLEF
jgi:phosphate transport system substrate-binding protein